jgi:hypothetical protein
MPSHWERVRALEGRTLPAVSGRAKFNIMEVNDSNVQVVPEAVGSRAPSNARKSSEPRRSGWQGPT